MEENIVKCDILKILTSSYGKCLPQIYNATICKCLFILCWPSSVFLRFSKMIFQFLLLVRFLNHCRILLRKKKIIMKWGKKTKHFLLPQVLMLNPVTYPGTKNNILWKKQKSIPEFIIK